MIKKRKDRALGHSKGYAKVPLEVPMLAAGGLYTSVIDLATFVQFHLNQGVTSSTGVRLLRPDILAEMYQIPFPVEGQTEGYALGIGLRTRNGHRFVGKDSGTPSFMVRVDDGATWDYNDGPGNPPGVGRSTWDRYIGEYSLQIWGKPAGNVKIYKKNGYLYLDELRLEEYRPGLFFASNGEVLDMQSSPPTFKNIRLSSVKGKDLYHSSGK